MTHKDFCNWLDGFLTAHQSVMTETGYWNASISPQQITMIKEKLLSINSTDVIENDKFSQSIPKQITGKELEKLLKTHPIPSDTVYRC